MIRTMIVFVLRSTTYTISSIYQLYDTIYAEYRYFLPNVAPKITFSIQSL